MSADLFSPAVAAAFPPDPVVGNSTPVAPVPARRGHAGWSALWRRPLVALLALAVSVLAVYAPSLSGQFLWDDTALVLHNLLIRSPIFGLEVFRHNLFNGDSNFYRPTQTLTFIVNYWFWALDPFGYHLTSVLIHAANAFLLFLILRRVVPTLLPTRGEETNDVSAMAFAVALVWALHPVHSAAVAYVSGSADSLAMMCCLTAWLCCERALTMVRSARRVAWTASAFVALLLGLCSKEIAFVWIVIFSGYFFGLRRGSSSRLAKRLVIAGILTALLAYAGLRHLPPTPPSPPPMPPLPARGLLMIRALGDYGSLMVFPDKLFMERQVFAAPGLAHPEDPSVYLALAVGGVLTLVAFAVGAALPGRGRNLRRFGACWFLLGFLPISNLFSLNASVAEHWLYLPSIGFLLFLLGAALDLPFTSLSRRQLAAVAATAVVLAATALGVRTWYRTFDWSDEITFFRQTIADGGDVPRARAGLAAAYSRQNDDAHAIDVLRAIVTRYPNVIANRINLANALGRQGQSAEARGLLEKTAADLFSGGGDPREVVAVIHSLDRLETDNPEWSNRHRALLANATLRHPDSWELVQLGTQDAGLDHDPARALALAQSFADAHWWHAPARLAVGSFQVELGRPADALASWAQAARLDVHDAEAPSRAAMLCLQRGQLDDARTFQNQAVRRQPDSPKQHALFARVLERRGETAAAAAQLGLARELVETADGATLP